MNEQLTQFDFPGEVEKSGINPALISMQIQALQESLRRLLDEDDMVFEQISTSGQHDGQTRPEC
ncbi:MAG: hypothetical protein IAF02_01195 [Anaerolineae bacterium]|nr:hypothetical protein [Anaerolineae bacterium]